MLHGGVGAERKSGVDKEESFAFMGHDRLFPGHVIEGIGLCKRVLCKLKLVEGLLVEGIGEVMPFNDPAHGSDIAVGAGFEGIFVRSNAGSGNESVHRLNGLVVLTKLPALVVKGLRGGRGAGGNERNEPRQKQYVRMSVQVLYYCPRRWR